MYLLLCQLWFKQCKQWQNILGGTCDNIVLDNNPAPCANTWFKFIGLIAVIIFVAATSSLWTVKKAPEYITGKKCTVMGSQCSGCHPIYEYYYSYYTAEGGHSLWCAKFSNIMFAPVVSPWMMCGTYMISVHSANWVGAMESRVLVGTATW